MRPHGRSDPGASDGALLAATTSDPSAFGEIYRRWERPVLAYFERRIGDPELAADLCAETFAAALCGAERYQALRETAGPWLFGIAHNVLGSSLRQGQVESRARRRLGMREPLMLTDEDLERVEALGSSENALLSLLSELPSDQRLALEARVLEELPYREIAARLSTSELVARQRVSRGLSNLRDQLERTP